MSQYFLRSASVIDEILKAVAAEADDVVLEIGAGTGALTAGLARTAGRVLAVELDSELASTLRETVRSLPNVDVLCRSILSLDLHQVAAQYNRARIVVVGNLPYHLTTRVILYLLAHHDVIKRATVMVQKEYGDRLLATPGNRDYGAITLRVNYSAAVARVTDVPSSAFHRRPKVDSTVLALTFRDAPAVCVSDESFLFKVIRNTFGQRRKMLVNSLSRLSGLAKGEVKRVCMSAGMNPDRRPETLSLEEFAKLADALSTVRQLAQ